MRENSKVRRSNGGQESNRVKRESSRVTPSRGGNGRYKVIAQKQRQSSQDRSITSQTLSAPRLIRRRGGEGEGEWREASDRRDGREASGPGRRGIPLPTTQAKHETHARGECTAMARTASLQSFAECSPACRNWPTTTASGQVADDDRDPSCRYCPQFTRRLYWPLLVVWPNSPRAIPTLPWPTPTPRQSGSLLHTFWPLRLLVVHVEGSWAIPGGPGLSWTIRAVLGSRLRYFCRVTASSQQPVASS